MTPQHEAMAISLNPEALLAAYEAFQAHKSDPGRKGDGLAKAIVAYLAHAPQHEAGRLEPVAFRIKRYGEIQSGVFAWSEWMLFQNKELAGPWAHPENIICEPLYPAPAAIETLTRELEALRGETYLASAEAAEYHRDNAIDRWAKEKARAEAAEAERDALKLQRDAAEAALEDLITAWRATKSGESTVLEVQRWLIEDMKPAFDRALAIINARKGE